MADVLSIRQRSYCMSQIRGRNTKPELLLRKALWANGLRYRIKNRLPGRPDIIFPGSRIAIFVDGCFWHGCPEHYQRPQNNKEFWRKKLEYTQARDQEVNQELKAMEWTVLRFWEHEVKKDIEGCLDKVFDAIL